MRHTLLASALIVTAAVAAGCSESSFKSLNDSFSAVKTSSGVLQNANLAAGAIASNMAAMQVLQAIAGQQSNVIAAGGSNVIGAGNSTYALLAVDSGTFQATSDDKDKDGKPNVDVKYTYKIQSEPSGLQHWELSEVTGTAYGYAMKVAGKYDFTPDGKASAANKLASGHAKGSLSGELALNGKTEMKLKDLSFEVDSPLPQEIDRLGGLALETIGNATSAKIDVSRKGGIFSVKGSLAVNGVDTYTLEADQNSGGNPKITKIAGK